MANPYYDKANKQWKINVRNGKTGNWGKMILCKGEHADEPPAEVLKLAAPYMKSKAGAEEDKNLRGWCDVYQARHPSKRENGVRRRIGVLRRFCDYMEGQGWNTLDAVGVKQINEWVDHRNVAEKASLNTIVADLAIIQGMFRAAIDEGRGGITNNPAKLPSRDVRKRAAGLDNEEDENEEIKYYTKEQQFAVMTVLPQMKANYRDFVTVLAATGIRADAALKMEASWIDEKFYIRVPKRFDKGKKGYRAYTFGAKAKEVLNLRMKENPNGRLFHDIKSSQMAYHYLGPFYKRHGLDDIVEMGSYNHVWRHTFAVRRVEEGIALHILQQLLGHHSIKMTQRYAKVTPHELDRVIGEIEKTLATV